MHRTLIVLALRCKARRLIYAVRYLIVTAAILIPVRAFVLSATLFHAPRFREKNF
jgi:hypothetical protein